MTIQRLFPGDIDPSSGSDGFIIQHIGGGWASRLQDGVAVTYNPSGTSLSAVRVQYAISDNNLLIENILSCASLNPTTYSFFASCITGS